MQWDKIPADTDVLLNHGPPYDILDDVLNDQHAGDKDLLNRIVEVKLTAHARVAQALMRQGIKFINACVLNEAYKLVHKPIVFELYLY